MHRRHGRVHGPDPVIILRLLQGLRQLLQKHQPLEPLMPRREQHLRGPQRKQPGLLMQNVKQQPVLKPSEQQRYLQTVQRTVREHQRTEHRTMQGHALNMPQPLDEPL